MAEKWRRNRDGCIVCRRRRKRCDLRKPTCGGCERNALLCRWELATDTGDQLPLGADAPTSMSENPPLHITRMSLGVASHMLKSPISSLLYSHYLDETGNAISANRGPLNSFIRLLPCLAMTYPNTVLQSLLALSGVHYGSPLKTIRPDQDGTVVHHLKAADVLFNRLVAPREQKPVDEEILEFLKEFYIYIRMITVLTGSSVAPISPLPLGGSETPLFASQRSPGNLLGCSYELFNLVPQIETLVNRRENYQDNIPMYEMDELWGHNYALLHYNLSSWQPPESSPTEFALGGSMYQQALLCLIERTSPFIDAQDLQITTDARVTQFLDILNSFPVDAPISSTIIWPLVFFGVLTNNEAYRDLIYERLAYMQSMFGFGNIKSSMSFLRLFWDQQSEGDQVPYGFGSPLISAIYGGGQLPMFLGWIIVLIFQQCVAISLAELISRFPFSGGSYFWSFQLASQKRRKIIAFITGWTWLTGNWTITLSVNFGFASLISAAISIYHPEFVAEPWQLLLIFYGICLAAFLVCSFGNRYLPILDTICAIFTLVTILVTLICLSVKANAGRHSIADTLGYYDKTLSGWGNFSFWIGILPSVYA
ncbi:hypothetical protein N7456_003573 [Penicillium angulare]|uniref:Zn(2)-C6 fungal-type domain-containing protein n=1 Tax=Penicillium angulare TaxID=116970 RepID=A0A9W9FV15_9EURO|nr:hypothetical protein N7456_003573 [Penicillium angulare]